MLPAFEIASFLKNILMSRGVYSVDVKGGKQSITPAP